MFTTLGMLEIRSIAKGIETADIMVKAADIELIFNKTTCPGKYLIFVSGDVGAVEEAVKKGIDNAEKYLLDCFVLPSVHTDIADSIKGTAKKPVQDAIAIFETSNVVSGIIALDKALKSGQSSLIKLSLGIAVGGKAYFILTGDVSSLNEALNAAQTAVDSKKIIESIVIPYPSKELLETLG